MTPGFPQDGRDGIRSVTALAPGRRLPAQKCSQRADTPLSALSRTVDVWKWPAGTPNETKPSLLPRGRGRADDAEAVRTFSCPFGYPWLDSRPRRLAGDLWRWRC